jgi:excisionase family DNA binding protein|tara:strand:+ start:1156 stop:1428 length:273 start_codon:yes stop_codon:yes gene_type:complete
MKNPFETINARLSNIEDLILDIKHAPKENLSNKRYSIKEAAAILRVIPLTVRNYIKNGNLKAEQLGRKYYILHSDLFNSFNEVKSLKYKR